MTVVAIVGCGPAGLLAAHAVERAGHTPVVYSLARKPSPVSGGVFIHQPMPGLHGREPDGQVRLRKLGEGRWYARKVYGAVDAPTSWDRLREGNMAAWALRPLYDRLWAMYEDVVVEQAVDGAVAAELAASYRLVLNTAPLPSLCVEEHDFPERQVWWVDKAPSWVRPNEMVYNGRPEPPWFRSSVVFGVEITEFGIEVLRSRPGRKVLPTNCTCHPRIKRIGRWGTWTPGVLLHHAYWGAVEAMAERGL